MELSTINDIRTEFKNITFSKFQKSKAKQELINAIYNCKIENACYWCAEYICAAHFLELWDIIVLYTCKYIHSGNPKLSIYLSMRYDNFVTIVKNGYLENMLLLRNNPKIRHLFSEIICILCYSNKKHIYQNVKLNKVDEFDLTVISNKFKAPNMTYINNIFREEDPKELLIPINELIYNLSVKNIIEACYWYEWILEYESICKKKKKKCVAEARMYAPNNNQNDVVWILWDIVFFYSKPENNIIENFVQSTQNTKKIMDKVINSLFNLYTIKYNSGCKRKRKFILYFAFSILIDNIDFEINITNENDKITAITSKIDNIYKDIKKNEIAPNTDYLFTNLKKSNMEKTIEKIDMINNIMN